MIRIVTDSSCDLPQQLVENLGISVVPLTIRFGDREYVDGVELAPDAFWDELERSPRLPETAAPSAGAFGDTFSRLFSDGADGIVAICMSGQLSATYQAAVIAAEQSPGPVRVIDSRNVSMGLGFAVMEAAAAAQDGATIESVLSSAVDAVDGSHLLAALDTLEYLKRGGRIGGARALVGTILDVKPLIAIQDGAVEAAGRVRTRSKARQALLAHLEKRLDRIDRVAILHGRSPDVSILEAEVTELFEGTPPIVAQLGPVVGTHAGPGALGVSYRLR